MKPGENEPARATPPGFDRDGTAIDWDSEARSAQIDAPGSWWPLIIVLACWFVGGVAWIGDAFGWWGK